MIFAIMKAEKKATTGMSVSGKKAADQKTNPFVKLMEDKKRIAQAVKNKVSLATLKDIKFVRPL